MFDISKRGGQHAAMLDRDESPADPSTSAIIQDALEAEISATPPAQL
ncbi:hypothetical protein ACWCOV_33815 [Kribbella sp. NPDC002412]